MASNCLPYQIQVESSLNSAAYDTVIFVCGFLHKVDQLEPIYSAISNTCEVDNAAKTDGAVLEFGSPSRRLVYSPVSINIDFDDVRSFGETAKKAIRRALKAGAKKPLFVLTPYEKPEEFPQCSLVTLLGFLEGLYVNLQYREDLPSVYPKINSFGVYFPLEKNMKSVVETASILEGGRIVARDIGGGDPERMTPTRVKEYIDANFKNSSVKVDSISDEVRLTKEFPLFAAVNRAASVIERHRGQIIFLTYESDAPKQTLFLVGKGVTYDTGGADIKAGGVMAGMSRDKCGAAAAAGFMKVLELAKPKNIKVVAILPFVRNSVGENSYVADEYITARCGKRVRVNNTDAEGRMILGDTLCYAKEQALKCVNPHLITIATLTGHAYLTVGPGYSLVMDNSAARKEKNAEKLAASGCEMGEPVEISTIRREDLKFHLGKVEGEDVYQAGNQPSVKTARGHQGPAAFLLLASGLTECGMDSKQPIKYSHIDIAGSAGDVPENPTGAPILSLFNRFIINEL